MTRVYETLEFSQRVAEDRASQRWGGMKGWRGGSYEVWTNGYGPGYQQHGTMTRKDARHLLVEWCQRGQRPAPAAPREGTEGQ